MFNILTKERCEMWMPIALGMINNNMQLFLHFLFSLIKFMFREEKKNKICKVVISV